jgi:hypothetical protein
MDCHAPDRLPSPSNRHGRLRLGQRHDRLLSHSLPLRRIPSGGNLISVDCSSIRTHSFRGWAGARHYPRLHWYRRQLGPVNLRFHLNRYVACSFHSLPVRQDLEGEQQIRAGQSIRTNDGCLIGVRGFRSQKKDQDRFTDASKSANVNLGGGLGLVNYFGDVSPAV